MKKRKKRSFQSKVKARQTRTNNKLKKDYPLLAWGGVLKLVSYEECAIRQMALEQDAAIQKKRMDRFSLKMFDRAVRFRSRAERHSTSEELAEWDERVKRCPQDPIYYADFWRGVLRSRPEWQMCS